MPLEQTTKIYLAQFAGGRMLLHFACLCRGGKWGFHLAGIRREWAGLCRSLLHLRKRTA
jgi:hypothetical protein